jgi:hypothetical protein
MATLAVPGTAWRIASAPPSSTAIGGARAWRQTTRLHSTNALPRNATFSAHPNAYSVLGLVFGMAAIAAASRPDLFDFGSLDGRRAITMDGVAKLGHESFGPGGLATQLAELLLDKSRIRLSRLRNVLVHRASPGRNIQRGAGATDPLTLPASTLILGGHFPDKADFDLHNASTARGWLRGYTYQTQQGERKAGPAVPRPQCLT